MPNKDNARKALRQAAKRTAWNRAKKDAFKVATKKVLASSTFEEAKKLVSTAQKALDKAAKTGAIKKKTAARKLSRLMAKVNAKNGQTKKVETVEKTKKAVKKATKK